MNNPEDISKAIYKWQFEGGPKPEGLVSQIVHETGKPIRKISWDRKGNILIDGWFNPFTEDES